MTLKVKPCTLKDAKEFIAKYHRHNDPPVGHKYSISLWEDDMVIGYAVVGRPVARHLDDKLTAEVVRLCVMDNSPKGSCSMLYRACWRSWKEMGGLKIITYTLQEESGESLRGAGWLKEAILEGASGKAWTNRPNRKDQEVVRLPKYRWSCSVNQHLTK